MYPSDNGTCFVVQQTCASAQFTGVEHGRARLTVSNADPNAVVYFAAKLFGSIGNAITVRFVDAGAGTAVTNTTVGIVGSAISVYLKRGASGSPTATAAEIATLINATTGLPVRAKAGGDGTGTPAAASATNLTGGANPASSENAYYHWAPASTAQGLFTFEQTQLVEVSQFECKFTIASGTHTVTVSRVPLDDVYSPISGQDVPVMVYPSLTNAAPTFAFGDTKIRLPPRWALKVTTSSALDGFVRFDVRKSPNWL